MGKRDRERVKEIRREKWRRRKKRLKFLSYILLLSLIIYGILQLKSLVYDFLMEAEVFRIDEIVIYPPEAEELISAALDLEKGGSLLFFNADSLREKLEQLPGVKSSRVRRRFPSTLEIDIFLREPWTGLIHGGETVLIDRSGKILEQAYNGRFPVVDGIKAYGGHVLPCDMSRLDFLGRLFAYLRDYGREEYFNLEMITFFSDNRVVLRGDSREIIVAMSTPEKLLEEMEEVLLFLEESGRDWVYIDARFRHLYVRHR